MKKDNYTQVVVFNPKKEYVLLEELKSSDEITYGFPTLFFDPEEDITDKLLRECTKKNLVDILGISKKIQHVATTKQVNDVKTGIIVTDLYVTIADTFRLIEDTRVFKWLKIEDVMSDEFSATHTDDLKTYIDLALQYFPD